MDIKIEEHPIQVKPASMGTPNSVKHESGKVFCCNGNFKSYCQAMYTKEKSYIPLPKMKTLLNHQRLHTGNKTSQCSHCDKCLVQNKNLFKHQINHTDEKLYICNQSDKCFTQKQKLANV